jgi:outer membrane immunogenic protein
MKKISLSLSLIVITMMSVKAQVKFGIRGGMNVSSITNNNSNYQYNSDPNSDDVKFTARIGYNAGVFANIHLKGLFSLETEAIYSLEGAKDNFIFADANGNVTSDHGVQNFTYLQVPVMARITFFKKRLFGEIGPQVGFLLSAKNKPSGQSAFDDKSDFNTVDCSIVTSVGYMFPSGIGFNLRYYGGLIHVFKGSEIQNENNSTFQVNALYQFGGNGSDD